MAAFSHTPYFFSRLAVSLPLSLPFLLPPAPSLLPAWLVLLPRRESSGAPMIMSRSVDEAELLASSGRFLLLLLAPLASQSRSAAAVRREPPADAGSLASRSAAWAAREELLTLALRLGGALELGLAPPCCRCMPCTACIRLESVVSLRGEPGGVEPRLDAERRATSGRVGDGPPVREARSSSFEPPPAAEESMRRSMPRLSFTLSCTGAATGGGDEAAAATGGAAAVESGPEACGTSRSVSVRPLTLVVPAPLGCGDMALGGGDAARELALDVDERGAGSGRLEPGTLAAVPCELATPVVPAALGLSYGLASRTSCSGSLESWRTTSPSRDCAPPRRRLGYCAASGDGGRDRPDSVSDVSESISRARRSRSHAAWLSRASMDGRRAARSAGKLGTLDEEAPAAAAGGEEVGGEEGMAGHGRARARSRQGRRDVTERLRTCVAERTKAV
jgi:hypothetical protein